MNDLEICKKIAEIEGYVKCKIKGLFILPNFEDDFIYSGFYLKDILNKYNPIKDDALCFALSKKYNVSIMHYEEYSTARIWVDPEDNPIADFSNINNDTSLNKAICLAIIEAHKDQT